MKFDAYEYIGVIVPGSILVVALTILFPSLIPALGSTLSLGDFGLVLIFSFIAGHLLQAIGNLWEAIIWSFTGGMPTTWAAEARTSLLTDTQLDRLTKRLQSDFSVDRSALSSGRGPMREIVVRIRREGKSDRIEKFNRNYGLMRGIAAGFIVTAGLALFADSNAWRIAVGLLTLAAIATYRMVRFGKHYACEVYAEYLSLPQGKSTTKSANPPS